jgi:predicted RNA-binding protein YlqC (UPF0109 family)
MNETLLFIIRHIVDHPDDVAIVESRENDRMIFTLHVHPEDMGKVIGKQGRIIRAVRDLVKLMAAKERVYADVVLSEEEKTV